MRASTALAVGLFVAASVAWAEEVLEDDFSDVDASRDLWQFVHGPSKLADGVLVQRCAIVGQTARAVLAGDATLDQRGRVVFGRKLARSVTPSLH